MADTKPVIKRWVLALLVLVLVAGSGAGLWLWLNGEAKPDVNWPLVYRANNQGIGHMEQFRYKEAAEAFEEVQKLAPEWFPGKINNAIAILNFAGGIQPEDPVLGSQKKPLFRKALAILLNILQDPDTTDEEATYAHFCAGLIYKQFNRLDKVKEHMEEVTKLDPLDPNGWFYYGYAIEEEEPKKAAECFEKAYSLAPYNSNALYKYQACQYVQNNFPEKREKLLQEFQTLEKGAVLFNAVKERYTELGHYATVIGDRPPSSPAGTAKLPLLLPPNGFKVTLAPGSKWATAQDWKSMPGAELLSYLRTRYGGTMVPLDYNRDGKQDLLMLNAIVSNGTIHHLLMRNNGNLQFEDVTKEAGLSEPFPGIGCSVGDFTNDGYSDLVLTGAQGIRLFQNTRKGAFTDVTKTAGLSTQKDVCLFASFIDLDQDWDLDLFVSQIASSPEAALKALKEGKPSKKSRITLYLNTALAKPKLPSEDPPPMEPKFKESEDRLFQNQGLFTGMALTDIDLDLDIDPVAFKDAQRPEMLLNNRLLRLEPKPFAASWAEPYSWNGAVSLAANRDEKPDLLLVPFNKPPILLLHKMASNRTESLKEWFDRGPVQSPPLRQAQVLDLDLDGWTDIVGLSMSGKPVLLRNKGAKLQHSEDGLGPLDSWPTDLLAISAGDFNGDAQPDLVAWSEKKGMVFRHNQGNGNKGVLIRLNGRRRTDVENGGEVVRCNVDGIGTWAMIHTDDHWAGQEYTTLSTGLGQSTQPLLFGLGKHTQAQVLRLRWPDICWQAEFSKEGGQLHTVREVNRKVTSCPIFFAWNGKRFVFITDFLGAGTMAELEPNGIPRPPRPEESVKIQSHQLQPKGGELILKLGEPMNEATYLDRAQLLVLDTPDNADAYPDERFATGGPPVTQDLLSFDKRFFPLKAKNHRNQDVTKKLEKWDRDSLSDFAWRPILGFAEEHFVEMDFGDQLKDLPKDQPLALFLAGHTEYAYPESIWAAKQSGLEAMVPTLEKQQPNGQWQAIAEIGFPAGMARMMVYDLTGKVQGPQCRLRIRTNLQIFWDQIFLAPIVDRAPAEKASASGYKGRLLNVTPLSVKTARLYHRGWMQEHSPDGKRPTVFDYYRLDPFPVVRMTGRLTRFGSVTELLHKRDDCFVIFGPGDEVDLRFDATKLPPLPNGWKRSYVFRAWGYCKGAEPFTASGGKVEPLPFHEMSNYPYGANEKYPYDPIHREYLKKYQTRQIGP